MNGQRFHVFAALILVLLIVAGMFAWATNNKMHDGDDAESAEASPSADVAASEEPGENEPAASESPKPTEKQPEPTPESTGTRVLNERGDFNSATETDLNTRVEWTATSASDTQIRLNIKVYAYFYSIDMGSRTGSLTINGETRYFTSKPILYTNDNKLGSATLYELSILLPAEIGETVSLDMSMVWDCNISYNGKFIDDITCSDSFTIQG